VAVPAISQALLSPLGYAVGSVLARQQGTQPDVSSAAMAGDLPCVPVKIPDFCLINKIARS